MVLRILFCKRPNLVLDPFSLALFTKSYPLLHFDQGLRDTVCCGCEPCLQYRYFGLSVAALNQKYGGWNAATEALGFYSAAGLQNAIRAYCGR
jgi:hypothetical protein